ncbi:polysaccharide deacetylase family protein [Sediminivirga luteola]|uniref:polysaccharide deacetylase family protein n=1 Tax=Sediminivirga luteola TaxID=1774748 RepID=UPI001F578A02|nr:polysaccharide deacetylase [Sediminivirga luteola]MCI2265081.1 polysaccharide deacetylase [Sediminivirga luteola]
MPLNLPAGKTLAVSIGADFDAHSVWMGTFGLSSPSYLSRGEFGAEVGVPRLLDLFERYSITTTWCTPAHTMLTFPERFGSIVERGHEIAAHGCWHEPVPKLDADEERRLMEQTLRLHEKHVGKKPRGYRSPAWDFTETTLGLLEEFGFEWDSSLMGRDFEPYRPRPVTVGWEDGSSFGEPSSVLEFPVSWYLDDFPDQEYIPGANPGLGSSEAMFKRFQDHFDYAYKNVPGGVLCITVHPQTVGRAHMIMGLERLIDYMASFPGTWFAPISDIYDTWSE